MILQLVAETVGWAFVGVLLLYGGVRLFDLLDPIDYREEIRKGNVAAGVIVGAFIVAIASIVIAVILT
ncbi:DUF350 domain-containing protein [Oscillatoria sp. FACHB-1407]|uniref:DUF350 domain-containing protein n=1 Tax=Oscillatoria sp. FACHB-1407 TaxID=2692847 RepID=UPI002814D368|nr:DUF350 domain-containing protein [Oscillatoria sp. FACHB-1407]